MDEQIKTAAGQKPKSRFSKIINILVVPGFFVILFLAYLAFSVRTLPPAMAINAETKSYLNQIKTAAAVYFNKGNSYIGLENDDTYAHLSKKIVGNINRYNYDSDSIPWHVSLFGQPKIPFSQQISENSFCARVRFVFQEGGYWCVDSYGNETEITERYCTSEKPYCEEPISLPQGYTLDDYSVEKKLETACKKNSDCVTSAEYLVQSRCPFVSLCLENKCVVVCPAHN